MPTLADGRRWVIDQFKHDPYVNGSPKAALNALHDNAKDLPPQERINRLNQVKSSVAYYYNEHHKQPVPKEVREKLQKTEVAISRANVMDKAREVMDRHGGAPTKQTILDAVERSKQERARGVDRSDPTPKNNQGKGKDKDREREYDQSIGY